MAIIYLTLSSCQVRAGAVVEPLLCPQDHIVMAKNGSYTRHGCDGHGMWVISIPRFRCRQCRRTFSALPYDVRPYTAWTWAMTWTIWVWHQQRRQTWTQILAWFTLHVGVLHPRTVQRWQARWRRGLPTLGGTILRWIAHEWGTRAVPFWPQNADPVQTWRKLWQGVIGYAARQFHHDYRFGGLLGWSALAGWLPFTFFAGGDSPG